MSEPAHNEPKNLNKNDVEGNSNSITKNNEIDNKKDKELKNITPQKKNNESKKPETPKKSNLKQMTLTEIAKNVSPKIKPPLNEAPKESPPKESKESSEINNSTENKTNTSTNKSGKDNETDNDNKLSFSKRNIVKILGCNYNSKKQLIFAVKLKKPDKTVYVSYIELKKRSPQILCDYFESLISFV